MPAGQANPFMNPLVRKALYQAIDAEAIVNKFLDGMGTVATQFLPPTAEAYDPSARRLPYDPKAARALLAQAGYPVQLVIEVGRVSDSPARRNAAAAIQRQLNAEKIVFDDPLVQTMMRDFGAKIVPGSIKPL
jgi:ABC-type transport system substrate-binding protein